MSRGRVEMLGGRRGPVSVSTRADAGPSLDERRRTRDAAAGLLRGANILAVEFIVDPDADPADVRARVKELEDQGVRVNVKRS